MDSLTLMIVDSSDEFRLALKNELQNTYQVYTSADGKDALTTAIQLRPDIIVLDLMLTGLDGITFLQELNSAGVHPSVMVVTRLNNAYVTEWVDQLGINYIMLKPCDPSAVARRVDDLNKRLHRKIETISDVTVYAVEQLTRLAFSPKHLGYSYLKPAIAMAFEKPDISITKELYPEIASRYHTSSALVERSIRSAINSAWLQRNVQVWSEFFPLESDGTIERPSNGAFIFRLVDELYLMSKNK